MPANCFSVTVMQRMEPAGGRLSIKRLGVFVVVVAVQQAGVNGPLDHVVAVIEQEAAKLDVGVSRSW